MTLPWPCGKSPMKPDPPTHITMCRLLWMGFIRFNCPSVKHKISVLYLVYFCYIRQGGHKSDLMVYNLSNPLITLLPFEALHSIGPCWCWGLGMLQAIIDISREHIFIKINKNKLFPLILSWFDLAVTLRWPYHDLGVTPLWRPISTHVTVYWPLVET